MNPEIIAFYLPQYHPTPHNNEWWGEGFTEWTNVAKAKPLFRGHYQPKVPADLGFYDLRMPEVRKKQAELAKEAGITGFCYYHYWFGNGEQELELPFNEVIKTGEPDFPFCLCWANETWGRKMWNKDGAVVGQQILAEQKYLGGEDDIKHFYSLLPAFKDSRYMRIDGKPIFMIYRPLAFKDIKSFLERWNRLAKENGLEGFYFLGYSLFVDDEYSQLKEMGFDAIVSCRLDRNVKHDLGWAIRKIISVIFQTPRRTNYKKLIPTLSNEFDKTEDVFPTMIPNWDHTPRSGVNGDLFTNSTPDLFQIHASQVLSTIVAKPANRQICFVKSWNEWGEGNYMEPDIKYGKGYINALAKAIKNIYGTTSNKR